jgi:superfamily II DNA or RNA helicase
MAWRTPNVWAREEKIDSNPISQLLVPESRFEIASGSETGLCVENSFGAWPASTVDRPLAGDMFWARLPIGTVAGDAISGCSWSKTSELARSTPGEVLTSFSSGISYSEGNAERPGLRTPQLGALHAVLGYWTTRRKTAATVVMPTGTGKTEAMLALLVAARLPRVLALVPSDALREQVAGKFERLGVLQELGIVPPTAIRPVVGRISHKFQSIENAFTFASACNVIVATPQALTTCDAAVRDTIAEACTHLFVDEAHHVAARTWSSVRDLFALKDVVQFTATPFREDGRFLQGKMIYEFPLREAQNQGYFSTIDYTAVMDLQDLDQAVAEQAAARLRSDLAAGFDHVLMARVSSIVRARDVKELYERVAGDLNPVIINSQMGKTNQKDALKALREKNSRIIVCVNMLGEGFDMPSLKVAAVHDPQKSLGVTLQFIGRFARTSESQQIGKAAIFVARSDIEVDRRLRELYAENSDWNSLLSNLTEAVVQQQQEISDFEDQFTSLPDEVTLRSLLPKMSTVVYRAPSDEWYPERLVDFFGEDKLYTLPIGLNEQAGVAWCVIEIRGEVRWGDLRSIEEVTYQLYVLYFDRARRLLYINNSSNDGVFQELASSVLDGEAIRFTGSTVYRVMADIGRLVPTTVGVIDARDQFRRFSMHVGSDVTESFSQAEAGTKSQTNISGGGYRDGEYVTISASVKGRIWSHSTARSLREWCDWCDTVGQKLLDDTISIENVIGQFILPLRLEEPLSGVLLAVEWPWFMHAQRMERYRLRYGNETHDAMLTDLEATTEIVDGSLRFEITSSDWKVAYEAVVEAGRLRYRCRSDDEIVLARPQSERPLSEWLNENGLTFILDGDRLIDDDLLYRPTWQTPPFDISRLIPVDWTDIDITKESQRAERRTDSVQYRAAEILQDEPIDWDIVIDDDGKGEIADLVAMRIDQEGLLIRLVHCKYSASKSSGRRLEDLYELCGQAQKSVMWRRADLVPFFKTLDTRARKKQEREGLSPFLMGDIRKLFEVREQARILRRRMEVVIVQPGLQAAGASAQQLELLASTEAYLRTTIGAPLIVWCGA